MKLLICRKCNDIFNLTFELKKCSCGESSGKYIDDLNAEIKGDCKGIGFDNNSLRQSHMLQEIEDKANEGSNACCLGVPFDAFWIPETATSIKRIE